MLYIKLVIYTATKHWDYKLCHYDLNDKNTPTFFGIGSRVSKSQVLQG